VFKEGREVFDDVPTIQASVFSALSLLPLSAGDVVRKRHMWVLHTHGCMLP
jgi:hypothetical protein